ncbi:MAG TPA: pilus assembly protein N-terminal domain-containing protein [Xanthobacteraceae bacterium]|nr:pilus assembly protein N-terminal domain-containing protein [Xanthobacteraceae bacterium]
MTAWHERSNRGGVRRRALAAAAVAVAALGWHGAGAESLQVVLDQARIVKLPDRMATIVVGNPAIADVSVQPGGIMVLTGRGYGATNVVVLDRSGQTLMERDVQVIGPQDNIVVVYRGVDRESYSCVPTCERRLMLGDGQTFFEANAAAVGLRNSVSQTGAPPPKN